MVAVVTATPVPEMVPGGRTVQVMYVTGLEQVSVTEPVKPATGVMARAEIALAPGLMLRDDGVAATVTVEFAETGGPGLGGLGLGGLGLMGVPGTVTVTEPKEKAE
jgi:hypothetical protein